MIGQYRVLHFLLYNYFKVLLLLSRGNNTAIVIIIKQIQRIAFQRWFGTVDDDFAD